jgi:uncharacterized membrane protein YeaQ/YmgE (transglycosylase-associated protein family)
MVLLAVIFLIVVIIWGKYVIGIILLAVFLPFTFISVRYSKMIPHISAESNTAFTFFIGYTFGPMYALIYGPIVGVSCYMLNSFISPGYMMTPIIAGITGAIVGVLHFSFHMSFFQAFFIGLIIRTLVAFPIFLMFYDPLEVTSHQVSQFLSNTIIYMPLLSALYSLISTMIH